MYEYMGPSHYCKCLDMKTNFPIHESQPTNYELFRMTFAYDISMPSVVGQTSGVQKLETAGFATRLLQLFHHTDQGTF